MILIFKVTKSSKLQWLQYRINHYILTTNKYLYKIGIIDSPICKRCNTDIETIEHSLWDCAVVQEFIENFELFLDDLNIPCLFNKLSFILGLYSNNRLHNINKSDNCILMLIKYYIYSTRCLSKNLTIQGLIYFIKENFDAMKLAVNHESEHVKNQFAANWLKWQNLIDVTT